MAIYNTFKLTNGGIDLEYKAQQGKELKFSKFELGDGTFSGNIRELTALQNKVMEEKVTRLEVSGTGNSKKVTIGFDLKNEDVTTGFYLREIGLFAKDPDTQEDVLVLYTNVGEGADYIAGKGTATVLEKLFNVNMYISDIESITAEIDKSMTYVSQQEYNEKIQTLETELENTYRKDETYSKDEIDRKVSSVYRPKGSVANREALESLPDKQIGDVYDLLDTGMNVVWTGDKWDDLGATVDLSNYYTKPEVDKYHAVYIKDKVLETAVWLENKQVDPSNYEYIIQVNGVTANHRTNIYLDLENQAKLTDGYTDTRDGSIHIFTSTKPEEPVTVNLEILLVKEGTLN